MRRAKAALISQVPERVYLSKTTLVVVPPILVEQWIQEIEKHTEDGALKVLRVEGELPGVARLLDYDVSPESEAVLIPDHVDGRSS
jgi:SNF2 family DNA or RNA helicase